MQPLNVAAIQSNLHWQEIDANLAMFEEKIWKLSNAPDLIILPEMFTTGFAMEAVKLAEPINGKTFKWMTNMAAQTKAVVVGSYIINDHGKFYNRLYAVKPDGKHQHYDKRHLFRLAGEGESFNSGKERVILKIKGWKVLPLICYDLRFPVWSRSRLDESTQFEYDVVLYVANWPSPRIKAWDTLLQARAIENQAYSIGVNRIGEDGYQKDYPGHSAFYDFYGNQLAYSTSDQIIECSMEYDSLEYYRKRFPFQADSDVFHIE